MSFANLKKQRGKSIEKISQKMEKFSGKKDYTDERIWNITLDDTKCGEAVIRFLPAPEGEDEEMVRIFSHFFQGKGGWYVENSLSTFGEADPVGELNSELWNSVQHDDTPERKQAKNQKRQTKYYTNIYVVDDPANPENNGKVFLYEFGPVIFERINSALHPKFKTTPRIDPFDLWEGANFNLRAYGVEKSIGGKKRIVPEYDESAWASTGPLASDKEMEEIWKQCYSLQELLDRKHFKTYDELKKKLNRVLGVSSVPAMPTAEDLPTQEIKRAEKSAPAQKEASAPWDDDEADGYALPENVDDDSESFFKNLVNDD